MPRHEPNMIYSLACPRIDSVRGAARTSIACRRAGPAARHDRERAVSGVRENGVAVFRNIPFAAPSVGAHRWRPPQPPATWKGVRDGSEFGAVRPQPSLPCYSGDPNGEGRPHWPRCGQDGQDLLLELAQNEMVARQDFRAKRMWFFEAHFAAGKL